MMANKDFIYRMNVAFASKLKPLNDANNSEDLKDYGIKELKDGLTLEILQKDFPWILEAYIRDAVIGINRKKIVWYRGTWQDGVWEKGTWENGSWEKGTWENGSWEKGTWENGSWEKGTWESGTSPK